MTFRLALDLYHRSGSDLPLRCILLGTGKYLRHGVTRAQNCSKVVPLHRSWKHFPAQFPKAQLQENSACQHFQVHVDRLHHSFINLTSDVAQRSPRLLVTLTEGIMEVLLCRHVQDTLKQLRRTSSSVKRLDPAERQIKLTLPSCLDAKL